MKKKRLLGGSIPPAADTPGSRIRAARIDSNLSIRELSALSNISPEALSMIENDKHPPSLQSLKKISAVLNRPIPYLGGFESLPEQSFGERFVKARLFHGLTKNEAAEKLGVDQKSIYNWEKNKVVPDPKSLSALTDFLQVLDDKKKNPLII
ncbi:helix-turn-helix transcriptional regulator [Paenibacillus cisolokensis]|uniref:helix-turn-helix domain-containing protein n=1 Tax=Paenibacillus cisolokensis TaxID=1658519 RepID=UPI003D2A1C97